MKYYNNKTQFISMLDQQKTSQSTLSKISSSPIFPQELDQLIKPQMRFFQVVNSDYLRPNTYQRLKVLNPI